jgi:hypothetical protein
MRDEEIINRIKKIMRELENVDMLDFSKKKYNQQKINKVYVMLEELEKFSKKVEKQK